MAKKKARRGKTLRARKLKSQGCKSVAITYEKKCRKFFQKQRKIHGRRVIPGVPRGHDVADPTPTRSLRVSRARSVPRAERSRAVRARSGGAILAATDDLAIVQNTKINAVAGQGTSSPVCEPSCASNGNVVFYTGNWFAAVSTNGGASFQYVDPYNAFPNPQPGVLFCCDQVVHYIKKIDTFVWLLQYREGPAGDNIQRLAFARTADVVTGNWQTFDLTPASLGVPGLFLDYPDLAVGSNMLYVTTNAFNGNTWDSSILVRLPLSGIQSGNITGQYLSSTTHFNFRVAQNCTTRAYWASHHDSSTLRVFSWGETETGATFTDVPVATWNSAMPYNSQGPDNRHWLRRADPRITGATKAGTEIWFAWGSNAGGANNRPHPFVQIARIRTTNFQLIENVNLWLNASAVCYPALSTNSNGEVGISCAVGGGRRHPSHAVGILTGTVRGAVVGRGGQGPSGTEWGDYMTVRRHSPNGKLFSASGFFLKAGAGSLETTPNFVIFGRASDVVAP